MEQYLRSAASNKRLIRTIYFSYLLIWLAYRFINGVGFSSFYQAELVYPVIDISYWLWTFTGIPAMISKYAIIGLAMDVLFTMSAIGALLFRSSKIMAILSSLFLFMYFMTFNLYTCHHYHAVGLLFAGLVFWTDEEQRFARLMGILRFYMVFVFVSAACWKIFRGTLFDNDHFAAILLEQNLDFLVNYPGTFRADTLMWLIGEPMTSQLIWTSLVLLQLSFALALFTWRFDYLLIIAYLGFAIGSAFFMNIYNFENPAFLIALLPGISIFRKT